MNPDRKIRILVIAEDPSLPEEFDHALQGIDLNTTVWYSSDFRTGVESSRTRQPDIVCLEMGRDMDRFRATVLEIAAVAPSAAVVAIFRSEIFRPEDSESAFLVEALRSGVRDFLRRPLSTHELQAVLHGWPGLKRLEAVHKDSQKPIGRILSIVSNKGGVGKSTVAVNLAARLAKKHPGDVLLIDASLQLGTCALMLDLQPRTTILDVVRERVRLDPTLLEHLTIEHESGLHFLAAPRNALEAAEISEDDIAQILQLARRSFRFVIVDTFPVLDNIVLSILDLSDRAVVVFNGTVPVIAGAREMFSTLIKLGFQEERMIPTLNFNHPTFAGSLGVQDIRRQMNREIMHVLPYRKRVLTAANTGQPLTLALGRSFGFGKALEKLVQHTEQSLLGVEEVRSPTRAESPTDDSAVHSFDTDSLAPETEESQA